MQLPVGAVTSRNEVAVAPTVALTTVQPPLTVLGPAPPPAAEYCPWSLRTGAAAEVLVLRRMMVAATPVPASVLDVQPSVTRLPETVPVGMPGVEGSDVSTVDIDEE